MCVVAGASSSNYSSLSFVSHKVNSTDYTALGEFINSAGTISFNVRGTLKQNGTQVQNKNSVSGTTLIIP